MPRCGSPARVDTAPDGVAQGGANRPAPRWPMRSRWSTSVGLSDRWGSCSTSPCAPARPSRWRGQQYRHRAGDICRADPPVPVARECGRGVPAGVGQSAVLWPTVRPPARLRHLRRRLGGPLRPEDPTHASPALGGVTPSDLESARAKPPLTQVVGHPVSDIRTTCELAGRRHRTEAMLDHRCQVPEPVNTGRQPAVGRPRRLSPMDRLLPAPVLSGTEIARCC